MADRVDISTELAAIQAAVYGEGIKSSVKDALTKLRDGINIGIADDADRKFEQCESFSGVDMLTWEQGGLYAASGMPYNSSSAIRTGYIYVNDNSSIMVSNPKSKTWKIYEYSGTGDSDFIKGSTATSNKDGIVALNSSTNYIRIQISGSGTVVSDAEFFMLAFPDGYIFKYLKDHFAEKKSISILFVGNSLTQDGIAYLPYVLKNFYPEVNFKFYMWYNGGKTLKEQYDDYFYPDSTCSVFSKAENKASWSNYRDSKTMSSICSTYEFDIVCLQEYFNYKSSYTVSDLTDWNNCRDYIQSHYTGGNALEFISLFHAPLRSSASDVFGMTKDGNALILQKTIAQDMIANGIAVYRALSTDLDSLGDQGHLSPDGVHTQEGLPCLIQTYVTLCWLFDKLSINKSVYGLPFKMTTAIYNTLNVPGANLGTGVIEGTDAQNLLAQEVAILSYKEGKKFVADNIFSDN